jgi:hypothetical protein
VIAVKFCRLSFVKSPKRVPDLPSQLLIFCTWRASWLRIVAASGVNFLESVAAGAGFFLARIVSPQFLPDRRAQP